VNSMRWASGSRRAAVCNPHARRASAVSGLPKIIDGRRRRG
jgi:hypothetical protein